MDAYGLVVEWVLCRWLRISGGEAWERWWWQWPGQAGRSVTGAPGVLFCNLSKNNCYINRIKGMSKISPNPNIPVIDARNKVQQIMFVTNLDNLDSLGLRGELV